MSATGRLAVMPVTRIIPSSCVARLDVPSLPELPVRLGAHASVGRGLRKPCYLPRVSDGERDGGVRVASMEACERPEGAGWHERPDVATVDTPRGVIGKAQHGRGNARDALMSYYAG